MLDLIARFERNFHVLSCAKHENGASAEEMENQLVCDMFRLKLECDVFINKVTDTAANHWKRN